MPSGVLFVHNNFPAQFRDLATTLLARGVPCAAVGGRHAPGLPGVLLGRYGMDRGTTPGIFPLAIRAEADLIRGADAYRVARKLKGQGLEPAVIVAHPGWGEATFLNEVWPDARRVMFAEFYYHGRGFDIGFDPEFGETTEEDVLRGEAKNAVAALAFAGAHAIVAPTEFQASAFPEAFRSRMRVIHEGVDVDAIRPEPAEPFALADGRIIVPGTPVITHVNNRMDALRGLHIFARALPRLMAEVPDAQVLVIGDDSTKPYGGPAPGGRSWREVAFDGLRLDRSRLHFLGKVPHARMLAALRLSTAHVYYSYPFVLSWSLVEAMASGCYVVGSDTPPLHDAIEDGVNGRLLPFFDVSALSETLIAACRAPNAAAALRAAARETAVSKFASRDGRAAWLALLSEQGLEIPAA